MWLCVLVQSIIWVKTGRELWEIVWNDVKFKNFYMRDGLILLYVWLGRFTSTITEEPLQHHKFYFMYVMQLKKGLCLFGLAVAKTQEKDIEVF